MAIESDFTIDQAGDYLVIRHVDGQTTVYTANQFYTWLAQQRDEPGLMVDYDPITSETPTSYTMREGAFLDCGDGSELHKYLSGGAIQTDKWDHDSYASGIRMLTLDAAANLTVADKGTVVEGAITGDTGRLLAYSVSRQVLWVRPDTSADTFDNAAEAITVDAAACGNMTKISETGEELWANPKTVGTFASAPYPQVYIEQNGTVLAEWSTLTNWDRDTAIDVLIKVTEVGVDIDSKTITAFARQQGDDFAHYEAVLTSAGQDVLVLNSAADLQNTTGDYYLMYDARTAAFSDVGDILTGGTSDATAEIVAVTDWNGDTADTGLLTLRGVKGTFQDGETITDEHAGSADANGTVGDTLLTFDAHTDDFVTLGQVLTASAGEASGAKRLLRGLQHDNGGGKLVAQVDHDHDSVSGVARKPYYRGFVDNDVVTGATDGSCTLSADSTTIVSGFSDVTWAFVNGTVTYDAMGGGGTLTPGERVTWYDGTFLEEGIFLLDSNPGGAAGTITLGNCTSTVLDDNTVTGDISGASKTPSQDLQSAHTMDKNFEQQASNPYDVIAQCGTIYEAGRTMSDVYQYGKFLCQEDSSFQMYRVVAGTITPMDGEIYRAAYAAYEEKQKAPFGENPGGAIFGARGVWYEGYLAGELSNIASVTDSDGDVNTPPLTITIQAGGDCEAGVQVLVAVTAAGVINKAMYTSHNVNNAQGDSTFELTGDLDQDTPSTGAFRVVDDSAEREHRYRYASWTGAIFTLLAEITEACDDDGGSTLLKDNGVGVGDIKVGDTVRNVTDGSWAHVTLVEANQITTTPLQGGGDNTWENGDTYSFHTLLVTYDNNDTVYVPFLDERAVGASVAKDVLYAAPRTTTVRGRKAGLKSHISAASVTTAGLNVALIMGADPNYNL